MLLRHLLPVCCACALALVPGCSRGPLPGRVLIVGVDGATLERIRPMIADGRLPNFARLTAEGASGPLRSMHMLLSPRIWTTVATGKHPRDHGIEGWVASPEEGSRLLNSHDRKVHALWSILSDAGLSVATVNWLITYPPEPIDGIMVSDLARPGATDGRNFVRDLFAEATRGEDDAPVSELDPVDVTGPTTYPAEWMDVVLELATSGPPLTDVPDPFADPVLPPLARQTLPESAYDADELYVRLALEIDERSRPDVLMVLLQGVDRASHWLWGGFEPPEAYPESLRFSPEERAASARALLAYYDYTDALLGRLLERYGDDDLVLVLSDHGFEAGHGGFARMSGKHDTDRALDGVLFARGPGIRPGAELRTGEVGVADVAPTVLAWLGLPVAGDMEGAPAAFLEPRRAVRRVPTYETRPVPRLPLRAAGVEDDVREELRQLGYVK